MQGLDETELEEGLAELEEQRKRLKERLARAVKKGRKGEAKSCRIDLAILGGQELADGFNIPLEKRYIPDIIEFIKKSKHWAVRDEVAEKRRKAAQDIERRLKDKNCLFPHPLQLAKMELNEMDETVFCYDDRVDLIFEALSSQVERGVFFLTSFLDLGRLQWIPPEYVDEKPDYLNWFQGKTIDGSQFIDQLQEENQLAFPDQEEEKKDGDRVFISVDGWLQKKITGLVKAKNFLYTFCRKCKAEHVKKLTEDIIRCIAKYLNCAREILEDQISEESSQFLKKRIENLGCNLLVAEYLLSYREDILDKIYLYDCKNLLYPVEREEFEKLMHCLFSVCNMEDDWEMDPYITYQNLNLRLNFQYMKFTGIQSVVTLYDRLSILLFLSVLMLRHDEMGITDPYNYFEPCLFWVHSTKHLVDLPTYFLNMSHPNHKVLSLTPSWYEGLRRFTYDIVPILEKKTFKEIEEYLNDRNFDSKDENTQIRFITPDKRFQIRVKKEGVANNKDKIQLAQFVVGLLGTIPNLTTNPTEKSEEFKCCRLPTSNTSSRRYFIGDYVIIPGSQWLEDKACSNKRWSFHNIVIESASHFSYVSSQSK